MKITSTNRWDRKVLALGRKGLSADTIARSCALSIHQVRYRLSQSHILLSSYRHGVTPEARRLMQRIDAALGTARELHDLIAKVQRTRKRRALI